MKRPIYDLLPMPIARAARQMHEHGPASEAYKFVSIFMEPLLKWYGAIAIVALRQLQPRVLKSLEIPPRNLSFALGHWLSPIQKIAKEPATLFPETWQPLYQAIAELRLPLTPEAKNCLQAIEEYCHTKLTKKTLIDFFGASVLYRNATRGHGATSLRHEEEFSPLLLSAYDSMLPRLDSLQRILPVYVDTAEIVGENVNHTLRECQGLQSSRIAQQLILPLSAALSGQRVYLFTPELMPIVELSPLIVRPPKQDALYYLNSFAGDADYLCYDGESEEKYRPDSVVDSLHAFFQSAPPTSSGRAWQAVSPLREDPEDLGFGNLGM